MTKNRIVNADQFCNAECSFSDGAFWHDDQRYWARKLHSCDHPSGDRRSISAASDLGPAPPWDDGLILGTKEPTGPSGIGPTTEATSVRLRKHLAQMIVLHTVRR